MGRIRREIEVNGSRLLALFDSGFRNTYIVTSAADLCGGRVTRPPRQVALGGRMHVLREICVLAGDVEGHGIEMDAYVIDELGPGEDGRPIEVLIGALAMQKWGIRLDPEREALDWSRYPREFVEF